MYKYLLYLLYVFQKKKLYMVRPAYQNKRNDKGKNVITET